MTPAVLNIHKANNIFLPKVPCKCDQLASTTRPHSERLCQVINEENVYGMVCLKICEAVESGKAPEDIYVKMNLLILKRCKLAGS